uniref:Glycine-rich cell wall structural protein 1 n=1 Tax=Castor canadensis TaxID=51338 RepID=A0A8B7UYL2_CASCN|nr:putative glycine-rich cell wall structural protein 1 [Castor canadensis]
MNASEPCTFADRFGTSLHRHNDRSHLAFGGRLTMTLSSSLSSLPSPLLRVSRRRSCSPGGGRKRGRKGRARAAGGGARLSLGARASVSRRLVFGRSGSASSSLWGRCRCCCSAGACAAAVGLGRRQSGAGRGAGGEGGGGEGGGPGGKMPLAQLADPWQKMAVESPSDSTEDYIFILEI